MTTWIYLAVFAYFLNAVSFVVDKYLLAAPIPRPFAYAFWVAVLSVVAVLLIPFGVILPSTGHLAAALVSGALFFLALIFFFRSVRRGDIAVSAAKAGAFTAIFSYIFSLIILPDSPATLSVYSLILLVAGVFFLGRAGKSILRFSIAAGFLFGLSLVLLKFSFGGMDYVNGVFWSRMGFVAIALASLFFASARKTISASFHQAPPRSRLLFVANKALIGASFLILYFSIKTGNVVVINALLGVQFLFVFLLGTLLSRRIPALGEYVAHGSLRDKLIGLACIIAGFLSILL
jgi:hypothetical protein